MSRKSMDLSFFTPQRRHELPKEVWNLLEPLEDLYHVSRLNVTAGNILLPTGINGDALYRAAVRQWKAFETIISPFIHSETDPGCDVSEMCAQINSFRKQYAELILKNLEQNDLYGEFVQHAREILQEPEIPTVQQNVVINAIFSTFVLSQDLKQNTPQEVQAYKQLAVEMMKHDPSRYSAFTKVMYYLADLFSPVSSAIAGFFSRKGDAALLQSVTTPFEKSMIALSDHFAASGLQGG